MKTISFIKKYSLILAGSTSLIIGIIGIFVPVLPTTPFILLAVLCYLHSSHKLYLWMVQNRFFGKLLKDYFENRGMPSKAKAWILAWLWLIIGITSIFATESLTVRIILLIVVTAVTIHILLLKNPGKNK